ncbi:hypothetical protein NSS91_05075 [Caldifermentibacillus hisashii]|uniref:hypothetical protein n=1 Tax=Caldifermentibacillus hisashii TaxID=996558 RepID=UPI0031FD22B9
MATSPVLVTIFGWKTSFFGDEPRSRPRFEAGHSTFLRRAPFSSSFCDEKSSFLTTNPVLVTIFGWKTSFFCDEPCSRRRFEVRNSIF